MSTKGKNKSKKGKKEPKTEKLTKVEIVFYELTIADCEKKISRLQHHTDFLDVNKDDTQEKVRVLKEDKLDKSAYLSKDLRAIEETNKILIEKIHIINQEYENVKQKNDKIISGLEEKYKKMHDQLISEIKILNANLNMLENFDKDQDNFHLVRNQEEQRAKEKEEEYKEALHRVERKIQSDRETMRKIVGVKLLHVSEEFRSSSTMRNATYTQRLIRENIALGKEIGILDQTQHSMDQQLADKIANHKKVKATFPTLERKKKDLILIAQQKINEIEQLIRKCEHIKQAYLDNLIYKNKYQNLMKYKMCDHYSKRELYLEARKLGIISQGLKTECTQLEQMYSKNDKEIKYLFEVIKLMRNTLLKHINIIGHVPEIANVLKRECNSNYLLQSNGNEIEKPPEEKYEEGTETDNDDLDDLGNESEKESYTDEQEQEKEEKPMKLKEKKKQDLLEELSSILKQYETYSSLSESLYTNPLESELWYHLDFIPTSSDSMREAFKFKGFEPQQSSSFTGLIPAQQDSFTIPLEHLERGLIFDVEKGSTLIVSSIDSNPDLLHIDEEEFRDDAEIASSSSISSYPEQPKTAKANEENQKPLLATISSIKVPPEPLIIDVITSSEDEEDGEQEEEEEEANPVPEESIEGEEEEMSIYMFY